MNRKKKILGFQNYGILVRKNGRHKISACNYNKFLCFGNYYSAVNRSKNNYFLPKICQLYILSFQQFY